MLSVAALWSCLLWRKSAQPCSAGWFRARLEPLLLQRWCNGVRPDHAEALPAVRVRVARGRAVLRSAACIRFTIF